MPEREPITKEEVNLEQVEGEQEGSQTQLDTAQWDYLEGIINNVLTTIPNAIIFPLAKVNARVEQYEVEQTGLAKAIIEYVKTYHPNISVDPKFGVVMAGLVYAGMIGMRITMAKGKPIIGQMKKEPTEEDQEKVKALREGRQDIVEAIEKMEENIEE